MLSEAETRGVLGHEMTHFALLDHWPDYRIASQLLDAMANNVAAHPSHVASARIFKLYTEVYCDRGGYLATRNLGASDQRPGEDADRRYRRFRGELSSADRGDFSKGPSTI